MRGPAPDDRDLAIGATDPDPALRLYLRELRHAVPLARDAERSLAREIVRHRERVYEGVARVPLAARRLLATWDDRAARGTTAGVFVRDDPRGPEVQRRAAERVRRVLAGDPRRRSGRRSARAVEAWLERLGVAVREARFDARHLDAARDELLALARALADARRRGDRTRVRALAIEVGMPVHRFERRMREVEVAESARNEAAQRMAGANLRLVVREAKRFRRQGVPFGDLIQEGNLGLLRAIELFDPERGFKLSTYAVWWIRQSLIRAVQRHGRTVRAPSHLAERLHRRSRFSARFAARTGRHPTPEELRRELGESALTSSIEHAPRTVSLDAEREDGDGPRLLERLADPFAIDPSEGIRLPGPVNRLETCLSRLSRREEFVVRSRFGFAGDEAPTLQGLARELGLSRERVRQIELRAMRKLREWLGAEIPDAEGASAGVADGETR